MRLNLNEREKKAEELWAVRRYIRTAKLKKNANAVKDLEKWLAIKRTNAKKFEEAQIARKEA